MRIEHRWGFLCIHSSASSILPLTMHAVAPVTFGFCQRLVLACTQLDGTIFFVAIVYFSMMQRSKKWLLYASKTILHIHINPACLHNSPTEKVLSGDYGKVERMSHFFIFTQKYITATCIALLTPCSFLQS